MENAKSIGHILLPTTVEFVPGDRPHVGQLIITPCHQGYGTTLGNALRRVLLSSLPGAAPESIKITGVQHEFSAMDGVLEDMIEIILNIKHLAVRLNSEGPVTLTLSKKGKGVVTAADFDKNSDVEVVNPEMKIATITDDKTKFEMEVKVGRGCGYVPVSEKETKSLDLGTIAIDSLYTPIRDIGYNIEMTRVGDVTNYEKLVMTIQTNGTVDPKEAVSQATKILMDHFELIIGASDLSTLPTMEAVEEVNAEVVEVVEEAKEEVVEEVGEATEEGKEKKTKKKAKK